MKREISIEMVAVFGFQEYTFVTFVIIFQQDFQCKKKPLRGVYKNIELKSGDNGFTTTIKRVVARKKSDG